MVEKNTPMTWEAQMPPPMLPEALWEDISRIGTVHKFRAGEVLYHQNVPSSGVYFIKSGRVKTSYINDDGIETILVVFAKHCMFGELSAIRGDLVSPVATALTDVTVIIAPTDKVLGLIDTNSKFSRFMIEALIQKLHTASAQLYAIAGKKVLARLTALILLLDSYGIPFDAHSGFYTVTHAELASLANTKRSNATVCLNHLAMQDLIELRRNGLKILSRERLEALSNDI